MIDAASLDLNALPSVPLESRHALPTTPSIYFVLSSADNVQYIGRSVNPRQRWRSHHIKRRVAQLGGARIAYLHCPHELLEQVELALINWFSPPLNGGTSEDAPPSESGLISNVSTLRKRINLTQKDLAEFVGVTETTIRNWESNRSGVDWFNRIAKLCEILKCKPSDLVVKTESRKV